MTESHYVTRLAFLTDQRLDRVLDSAIGEVAQKGIPGAERQESQSRPIAAESLRIQPIHYFVGSAVPTDGDEVPHSAAVGIAGDFGGVPRTVSRGNLDLNAAGL